MTIKNEANGPQAAAPANLPTIEWLQPVRLSVSAFSEFARRMDESLRELENRYNAGPPQPQHQPNDGPSYGAIKRHRRPR